MEWREFLNDISNKNNVVIFMVNEWQLEHSRKKLEGKILYATCMCTGV